MPNSSGRILLLIAAIALSACEAQKDEGVLYCLKAIEHLAKAPSTISVLSALNLGTAEIPDEKAKDGDKPKTIIQERIRINFDSANAYGTPIRNRVECRMEKTEYSSGGHFYILRGVTWNGEEIDPMQALEISAQLTLEKYRNKE